ncbi:MULTISPECIES: gliding motility protein RemB [Olivibacter]|uniref:Gliding motility protein RemB n=1 Tax=Olivibacter jilunii TaxID=985016 RepID=A0ABW6B756_9SPHI|nr:gliding motility protein RemB [Olivibacter sp. UJ_SKK_5.1]MDX3912629.1 gliding motility protein RemB [Pseudosphingobacterium sp.]
MKVKLPALIVAILLLSHLKYANGQSYYQPYSYQFYQKMNRVLYSKDTRLHTSIKPMIIDSVIQPLYDSLMQVGVKDRHSWLGRKLFNEHLIDVRKDDYTFYADFLPDFQIGRSFEEKRNPWINTRGFQAGLTIGKNFSFHTSFFENQALFPDYVTDYIEKNRVIPGQFGKLYDQRTGRKQDWAYVTANVSYTPIKYLNIVLGYDKNFIGDGYRSMLLSDVSSPYTFLKLTGTLGNVRYMSMWAYMLDPYASRDSSYVMDIYNRQNVGDLGKWGAFQYLDWNVTNRLTVGAFQSILWAPRNAGGRRGFDVNYLNPIIFLRPIETANSSSPDKVHIGVTAKYKILHNLTTYGQLLMGELYTKELFGGRGYMNNKVAAQIGFKGFDIFKVRNLNFLTELNTARPYTYQHFVPITAYTNYNQPLAHILGANFIEWVNIFNYGYKRFDFSFQANFSRYGLDPNDAINYGGNIFKSYENYVKEYGNFVGQGITTDLKYFDAKVSYLFNPKYNLRLELGGIFRQEKNNFIDNKTIVLNLGLKASFRNWYQDF